MINLWLGCQRLPWSGRGAVGAEQGAGGEGWGQHRTLLTGSASTARLLGAEQDACWGAWVLV